MPADALGEIMQIALTVSDIPRAVAFYRDRLGLPLLFDRNPIGLMSEVRPG